MLDLLSKAGEAGKLLDELSKGVQYTEVKTAKRGKASWQLFGYGALGAAVTFFVMAWIFTGADWGLYWRYNLARIYDAIPFVGLGHTELWLFTEGKTGIELTGSELVAKHHDLYHSKFWLRTYVFSLLSLAAGAASAYWRGRVLRERAKQVKDEVLRGTELTELAALTEQVEALWKFDGELHQKDIDNAIEKGETPPPPFSELQPRFTFAGVPLPPYAMQQNLLATGAMGTGKSNVIFDLADQVAAYGLQMICYDRTGEMTQYWYRAGTDSIFCPFDLRHVNWNPFAELENDIDFEVIAYGFKPKAKQAGDGEIFNQQCRSILVNIMRKLRREGKTNPYRATPECLWATITADVEVLGVWLADTEVGTLFGKNANKNGGAASIETLKEACKVLQHVRFDVTKPAFSLKKFVREGEGRRLFVLANAEVSDQLQQLTTVVFNILLGASLYGKPNPKKLKRVFLIDEGKSAGPINKMGTAITEGRKYGNGVMYGLQGLHQLDIFDEVDAKDIRANLSTQLIYRVPDYETSDKYSQQIGEVEVRELNDSNNWNDDHKVSGGTSTTTKTKRAVMASEINKFANFEGIVKLPGNLPAIKVKFPYKGRPSIASPWEPRDISIDKVEAEREAFLAKMDGRVEPEEISVPAIASEAAKTSVTETANKLDETAQVISEAAASPSTGSAPSTEPVSAVEAEALASQEVVEATEVTEVAEPAPVAAVAEVAEASAVDDAQASAEAALAAALATMR